MPKSFADYKRERAARKALLTEKKAADKAAVDAKVAEIVAAEGGE
jgi:hypothetical protein